ncbi:MAG: helix-turn-helix domain-containing protein [Clostridia bacterium]|nr:helix-turn-helix domain-containing protein [Clostridia bacterium]
MICNYNSLWELIIDKRMTKTEMHKTAGIRSKILTKVRKDEPVAMEYFAITRVSLACTLDDRAEINGDVE